MLGKVPSYVPKFRKLVPRLIKKMKVIISGSFKSEYNIGGVPDPFLQVEMLKLLCLLATNDAESSDQLGDLLAFVAAWRGCERRSRRRRTARAWRGTRCSTRR